MAQNKEKNTSKLPLLASVALLFYSLFKTKKNANKQITNDNIISEAENKTFIEELNETKFIKNEENGVSMPIAQNIIPFILPSSLEIGQKTKGSVGATEEETYYYYNTNIRIIITIFVPDTSLGYIYIENFDIQQLKITEWITSVQQDFINITKYISNENEILKFVSGKQLKDGYNLLDINIKLKDIPESIINRGYEFEALYLRFGIKYDCTGLSTWAVQTSVFNEDYLVLSDKFQTYTPMGKYTLKYNDTLRRRQLYKDTLAEIKEVSDNYTVYTM